ncbi:MAG: glycosyltransferase family 39 protein [Victivallaceae bacterium]|nr:glycosyltransferase family 39 protein [Victivallaceae bacterium]
MRIKKRFFLILLGIVLIALVLRLGTAYELQAANNGKNAVNFPLPVTDMCTYKRLAELISQGDFQDPFYINNSHKYQPFYNSIFLPLIYLTLGYSVWSVIIAQSLLGAATVYLVGLSTARIWNRQAAVIAAAMTAFSQMLILYTPYLLIATLQAFWMALIFYCAVAAYKSGKTLHWAVCVLISGCAILTRGNVWFLIPGLVALAVYSLVFKKHRSLPLRKKLMGSGAAIFVFLFLVILPQVPFSYRNSVLLGHFCGPSSDAPNVLSLGNTPESPPGGREEGWGPGPMEYPTTYAVWTSQQSKVSVISRIWDWFLREPLAFLELTYRKLLLFCDYRELPNNISLGIALEYSDFLSYGFLWTVFIMIPGLSGIYVLAWRSLKKHDLKMLLLIYFILAYCAATVAFYILARFRVPVIPLLAIMAAIFINRTWRVCKHDRRHLYIPYIAVFSIITMVCFLAYDYYRDNYEVRVIRKVRPNGIKVAVGNGKTMYLDNGPHTFGGWRPVPLIPEIKLKKQFKIDNEAKKQIAELEFSLIFADAGEATLRINNNIERVTAGRPGKVDKTFVIPLPSTGIVNISLVSANCRLLYLVDIQRDYGRSSINDRTINGEIVCRLFLSPPPAGDKKKNAKPAPVPQTADLTPQAESDCA